MEFYPAKSGIRKVDLYLAPSVDNLRRANEFIVMPLLPTDVEGCDAGATYGLMLSLVVDRLGHFRKIGRFTFYPFDLKKKVLCSCN